MDILNALLQGFATAGTPVNLLWALVGCTIGTAVGVLPGIGPATAVAMLLPITLQVEPTASMIFFASSRRSTPTVRIGRMNAWTRSAANLFFSILSA